MIGGLGSQGGEGRVCKVSGSGWGPVDGIGSSRFSCTDNGTDHTRGRRGERGDTGQSGTSMKLYFIVGERKVSSINTVPS